jgi:hypothetical protein
MAGFGADPEKLEIAITSSILCKAYPKDSEGDHWSKQMHQNPITILKLGIFFYFQSIFELKRNLISI